MQIKTPQEAEYVIECRIEVKLDPDLHGIIQYSIQKKFVTEI
jgi:hypothetical protein